MTNDESQMSQECEMTKPECRSSPFVIRHATFVQHLVYVTRHFCAAVLVAMLLRPQTVRVFRLS